MNRPPHFPKIIRMIRDVDISISPEAAADDGSILKAASRKAGIQAESFTILRRSIDARRHDIKMQMRIRLYAGEKKPRFQPVAFQGSSGRKAIVVGAGPAGLFAALTLLEHGIAPIVLERGKDVHSRLRDTALLSQKGVLDPESNYAFGEGGAGAFSDGKLYTRSSKRGDVGKVLRLFVQFGADEEILYDSHPHIGSDALPSIIANMRSAILSHGGEVRFSTLVTGLIRNGDETIGVRLSTGEEIIAPVILATGHSAKDVYRFLDSSGYALEPKGTAVGVRLEHKQALIDSMQYHAEGKRSPYLPPASYSFVTQVSGRGVYSFCMCPGGSVVPAATEEGHLVVNGMSPRSRRGEFANSGIVVEIRREDVEGDDPFAVLRYIEEIERKCWNTGFAAPAERLMDFIDDSPRPEVLRTTYHPGVIPTRLDDVLPPLVASSLREGLKAFGRMSHSRFLTNDALLIAPETRTSSPVRILRDDGMKQGRGLYPAGEGAGYAGGIVSAAIDGTEAALRLKGDYYGQEG